uniref:Uncharacterized protein n=1 Tax=Rhodosorus marinus TaxID=101924 RepID=A0A7S3E7P8_9RHOD|mmetsp:Transcript_12753/g.51286  ORF Transcript_12753/g.51286 Transcript_12753/m.51286 type:complete len:366 (+) Transcript_12753:267-1364(+)|eukprot:CAMPEP_0113966474 /NCGR_PEP_ID=MMETSP0011_2-20120614/8348_1 /TAXON_ID=101924 /ORGANISM="Rhodosorus marinus" /LENGTH=365 /DNA_ID=CAMNT_0000979157 /DNA_START=155 /DNA_END=1252 /DNA_ORIENTATION=- /assembly_acc=CAM_ASM_000156
MFSFVGHGVLVDGRSSSLVGCGRARRWRHSVVRLEGSKEEAPAGGEEDGVNEVDDVFDMVVDDDGSWLGMPDINTVTMVGYVAAPPDVRTTPTMKVAKFKLRVQRNYPASPGNDYFTILAFRFDAEFVEKSFKEGTLVGVEGAPTLGTWEKEGEEFYSVEITASTLKILDRDRMYTTDANSFPEDMQTSGSGSFYPTSPGSTWDGPQDRMEQSSSGPDSYYFKPPRNPSSPSGNSSNQQYAPGTKFSENNEYYFKPPKMPSDSSSGSPDSSTSSWVASSSPETPKPHGSDYSANRTSTDGRDEVNVPKNLPDDSFARGTRGGLMPRKKGGFSNMSTNWGGKPSSKKSDSSKADYRSDELPEEDPF